MGLPPVANGAADAAAGTAARGRPSVLGRRQAAGLLLALALLGAGRVVRQRLLVGPDGAWREELWLDGLVEAAAAGAADERPARPDGRQDARHAADQGAGPDMHASPGAPAAVADTAGTAARPAERPAEGAPAASGGRPRKAAGKGPATPLDPNTAPPDSLQLLPGVGPVLAGRIVAARQGGKPFQRPEDLLAVKGIGPASLARLKPFLRFPQPAPEGAGAPARADNPH